jgi:hypothetical protein
VVARNSDPRSRVEVKGLVRGCGDKSSRRRRSRSAVARRSTRRCRSEDRSDACTSYPKVLSKRKKETEEMRGAWRRTGVDLFRADS